MKINLMVLASGLLAVSNAINAADVVTGLNLNIGTSHSLTGPGASIAGGDKNTNSGVYSIVAGGQQNTVGGDATHGWSAIGGGFANFIDGDAGSSAIAGGSGNAILADSYVSFIGSGTQNVISNDSSYGFIGGGSTERIADGCSYATIVSGGVLNIGRSNWYSVIVGGGGNTIFPSVGVGAYNTIVAGSNNRIGTNCTQCTIGAGAANGISNTCQAAVISGGTLNFIGTNSLAPIIGGGAYNRVDNNADFATVSGGYGNTAAGDYGTVPGGKWCSAHGQYSLATGVGANADHDGCFVWGDSAVSEIHSGGSNQFVIRANGGLWVGAVSSYTTASIPSGHFIETTTGAYLGTNGWWNANGYNQLSDRSAKVNLAPLDPQIVLDHVAGLSIGTWSYTNSPTTRHIGPMAQDFYAAFGVGADDGRISTVDSDGVALVAIQGLYQLLKTREDEISDLRDQIASLKKTVAVQHALFGRSHESAEISRASASGSRIGFSD